MRQALELLAPARNKAIGIAAIDCGADAVYIAGPGFGARKAAGNSLEDIAELCSYAHRFGVRIFMTVNTIVYEHELEEVRSMMLAAQDAGVDAFIVQDLALTAFEGIRVPLHASTQCSIRDESRARFLASLGFSRLVLEREMDLESVKKIAAATPCELEFFVHGALCVCYSGQCYLSEAITGRSANRGECAQPCRSLYDLEDADGKVLVRDKALLSLKDYKLLHRLEDLARAGVCSFKIEGRLKNESYVKNVVREYSMALDALVARFPDEFCRASYGTVSGGFIPDSDKTFNRGYTELFLDSRRGCWSSMDAPKSMGEAVGIVSAVRRTGPNDIEITLKPSGRGVELRNGDGFSFSGKGGVTGFRGDVCDGLRIRCKQVPEITKGVKLFRNINTAFERELERQACHREIGVTLDVRISGSYNLDFEAHSEDGRTVLSPFKADLDTAENRERQEALLREQLSKRSGVYKFTLGKLEVQTPGGRLPLVGASTLNSIRRLIAEDLDSTPVEALPMYMGHKDASVRAERGYDYKADVANPMAEELLRSRGAESLEPAYEISHKEGAELMRTKYCVRYELGLCPVHQGADSHGPLFLLNNGRRLALGFDCKNCEMTVK